MFNKLKMWFILLFQKKHENQGNFISEEYILKEGIPYDDFKEWFKR